MRFAAAAVLFALPSTARADLFLPVGDGEVHPVSHRALIAQSGRIETLVFEMRVESSARRFVWLRPFDREPRALEVAESPFELLDRETVVHAPYNEVIRDDLFGPSVVTILIDRLFRGPPPPPPAPPTEVRDLVVEAPVYLSGQVTSSTITYELLLPDEIVAYMSGNGVALDQEQIRALAVTLNSGGVLMASVVEDAAPDPERPARIGPVGFAFNPNHTTYPLIQRSGRNVDPQRFEFFLVASTPRVSSAHETVWDVRPWERVDNPKNQFVVHYNAPVDTSSPIGAELLERQGLNLSKGAGLMRMSFENPSDLVAPIMFVEADRPIEIPSGTRRGSGFDLFLCILLGLAPLLYTPESWFLLWIASRARARARTEGRAFGVRLWSFYAIVVGVYWLVVLPDAARVAGVVPLLIGIVQLALPYTARDPAPVRAQFKTKKKKA